MCCVTCGYRRDSINRSFKEASIYTWNIRMIGHIGIHEFTEHKSKKVICDNVVPTENSWKVWSFHDDIRERSP